MTSNNSSRKTSIFALIQIILLTFSLSFGGQSGPLSKPESKAGNQETISTVSYCDLVKDQSLIGKLVRIEAIWAHSFEWSVLYSRKCRKLPSMSLSFDREENLCAGTIELSNKLAGSGDGFADIVMIGRLYKEEQNSAHVKTSPYHFVMTCLENGKEIFPGANHLAP